MAAEATAQEILSMSIRKDISPGLRKLGFKGSGQMFEIPNQKAWLLLGIQKSPSGAPSRLRFTINLTAVLKSDWASLLESGAKYPPRPNPNHVYGGRFWHSRIGMFMPAGQDYWWTVTNESDPGELARSVVSAVKSYALPALHERCNSLMREGG